MLHSTHQLYYGLSPEDFFPFFVKSSDTKGGVIIFNFGRDTLHTKELISRPYIFWQDFYISAYIKSSGPEARPILTLGP